MVLQLATDMIEALRYKLSYMGVLIDRPAEVLCDNKPVVTIASYPSSVLNKQCNTICYNCISEAQALVIVRTGWIP